MNNPKTIQIFLPDGNPLGVKKVEVTSRTVKGIFIPRAMFALGASEIDELAQPGVYFLFGGEDSDECYIGESENCFDRLKVHNRKKDFWDKAVVFVSKVHDGFTKSHVKYLEHYMINLANEVNRFKVINSNTTSEPIISESIKADIYDYFEVIKLLLSTLGFRVFDSIEKKSNDDLLFCKNKGAIATGEYSEEGFVVFKDSTTTLTVSKSAHKFISKQRENLMSKGILKLNQDKPLLLFIKDHLFTSPSTAAGIIKERNSNGWTAWKNEHGKTLHELKRK